MREALGGCLAGKVELHFEQREKSVFLLGKRLNCTLRTEKRVFVFGLLKVMMGKSSYLACEWELVIGEPSASTIVEKGRCLLLASRSQNLNEFKKRLNLRNVHQTETLAVIL